MTGADLYSAPAPAAADAHRGAPQPVRRVLFASLIGTTIEFFDFYIYATAAVLVFPGLFFPAGDATSARLQSLATFGLAFLARPVGSALFGHFGDRVGRKATLVAALLTMGISTVLIGLLPPYAAVGVLAPLLLAIRSEEHTSELQSRSDLVCRLLLEKKKKKKYQPKPKLHLGNREDMTCR